MNQRITILTILVIVTLGTSVYLSQRSPITSESPQRVLLGELSASANTLNQISIETNAGVIFEASKDGEEWVATHLDAALSFPVASDNIKTLVSQLSRAKVLEEKTSNADLYYRLGVEALSSSAQGALIRLASADKQWRLILGNQSSSGTGQFVRQPNQSRSFLIDSVIDTPLTSADWLDKSLSIVKPDDIATITWVHNGQNVAMIEHQDVDTDAWQLVGMEAFEVPIYPEVFQNQVGGLLDFNFTDVTVSTPELVVGRPDYLVVIRDKAGNEYEYKLFADDELSQYRLHITSDDVELWTSYWLFDVSEYESRVFKLTRDDFVQAESN